MTPAQWLNLTGDLLIAIAQFAIPLVLFRFILDSKFRANELLGWFAAFILLCALTHALGVAALFWPLYAAWGGVKFAAGIASLVALTKLIVAMPFRTHLEMQNILLVREASRIERNFRRRDISKAVQLRALIKGLGQYADDVDMELGGDDE